MATMAPFLEIRIDNFSNLNLNVSPVPYDKFWQNQTPSGSRHHLKIIKMATMAAILDIGMILAVLALHAAPMPPTKFQLKLTYGLAGDAVGRISRWPP